MSAAGKPPASNSDASPFGGSLNPIDAAIRSGNYAPLLDAIKGFRNGFVCGTRIRAPHSLALNVVWSPAPPKVILRKVFKATRQHAMNLGKTGFVFSILRSLFQRLSGKREWWHAAVAGFVVGFLFWGEQNAINVQMGLYILSRVLSGFLFVLARRFNVELPSWSFRLYSAVAWATVMYMFFYQTDDMQPSMTKTMKYIYVDNEKYTSWWDLLCVNGKNSF